MQILSLIKPKLLLKDLVYPLNIRNKLIKTVLKFKLIYFEFLIAQILSLGKILVGLSPTSVTSRYATAYMDQAGSEIKIFFKYLHR